MEWSISTEDFAQMVTSVLGTFYARKADSSQHSYLTDNNQVSICAPPVMNGPVQSYVSVGEYN